MNLGPLNPKSSTPQEFIQLVYSLILYQGIGFPPNFLDYEVTSLKSPIVIQGQLILCEN